jgi:HAD superfamily hydrolase (TIGR01549 family)
VPDAADRGVHAYRRMAAVFQTYYLGHELWAEVSGTEPPFDWMEPLMARETSLVSAETLGRLAVFALGIATSRPRVEALMALRQHGLARFFAEDLVVCAADTPFEKPHPAPLLELVRRLECRQPVYVGDTINDAIAADAAGMPFIHIGAEPLAGPVVPVYQRLASANELPSLLATAGEVYSA